MNNYLMNEYWFDFTVTDEVGNDVSDKIKIFPERYHGGSKPEIGMFAVIWDWNRYFVDNLPHAYIKDVKQSGNIYPISSSAYPLIKYNCASFTHSAHTSRLTTDVGKTEEITHYKYTMSEGKFKFPIVESEFSGTGTITLSYKDGETASAKFKPLVYYYTVNFFKKFILRYTYKDGGSSITFSLKDKARSDLRLKVMSAKDMAPCFPDKDCKGKFVVTLKKGEKNITVKKEEALTSLGNNCYRLSLAEDTDKQFYRMRYVGLRRAVKRMSDTYDRTLSCPFCLRSIKKCTNSKVKRIAAHKKLINCQGGLTNNNYDSHALKKTRICCDIDESTLNSDAANVIFTRYRKWVELRNENRKVLEGRDKNLFDIILLPEGYDKGKSILVSVIGSPGVGKSVFLSRLTGIMPIHGNTDSSRVSAKMTLLKSVLSQFQRRAAEEEPGGKAKKGRKARIIQKYSVEYVAPELYDKDMQDFSSDKWISFFNQKDTSNPQRGLLTDYDMPIYNNIANRTDKSLRELLQRHPFILSVGNNSKMVLFDVPGECFSEVGGDVGVIPTVTNADCLIMFVNVSKSGGIKSETESMGQISTAGAELGVCIKQIMDKHPEKIKNGKICGIALAVVLCKLDLISDKLDACSEMCASDVYEPHQPYEGSALQKNTYAAAEEIKRYISSEENNNLLLSSIESFEHHEFFSISALGSPDCTKADLDNQESYKLLYGAEPKRLEHVAAWLLWQTGIID